MRESINSAFRARYLNTHEKYVDSISTLLVACNTPASLKTGEFMIKRAAAVHTVSSAMRARNQFDEAKSLRNLRNSWYHECALYYPEDINDRMKFAPWKIIQFFYATYTALSAIVRCFDNHPRLTQKVTLSKFTTEIIKNSSPNFIPAPFNFYLEGGVIAPSPASVVSWPYGLSCHMPNVVECLQSVNANPSIPISLPHYFKALREWANYEDSYIFINLFGQSVISRLDSSIRTMVKGFIPIAEVFLISFYGWDVVQDQFNQFSSKVERFLKITPSPLITRFQEYSKSFSLIP